MCRYFLSRSAVVDPPKRACFWSAPCPAGVVITKNEWRPRRCFCCGGVGRVVVVVVVDAAAAAVTSLLLLMQQRRRPCCCCCCGGGDRVVVVVVAAARSSLLLLLLLWRPRRCCCCGGGLVVVVVVVVAAAAAASSLLLLQRMRWTGHRSKTVIKTVRFPYYLFVHTIRIIILIFTRRRSICSASTILAGTCGPASFAVLTVEIVSACRAKRSCVYKP
jgi:hypothetical protein